MLREGLLEVLLQEGYAAQGVGTLAEAWDALHTLKVDLVLLDVMLPDGDGIAFCTRLRERMAVPVVFLTARDEELHIVRGLDAGGDDYVTKPFRLQELLSRIRAALRRSQDPGASTVLLHGKLRLDTGRQRATLAGQDLALTPTELQLLTTLMRNAGRVLTRDQLLQSVWEDGGAYIEDNTLSVHISRLREKITEGECCPIETIRGIGYRFHRSE